MRSTYSSVYNTSAKGTPAPVASGQAATYSKPQTTQTTTYNSRGATAPPVSTASAGSQAGTVVVKVSGTTTSRITTPAVTASSNYVTTTAGKTTTSKQVGTPAVVATNSVKTTNTGVSATRITTPAVVAGHVTTTGSSGNTNRVGTPAVTVYTAADGSIHTLSKPAVTHGLTSEQLEKIALSKNLKSPEVEENSFMEGVHTALDAAGYIPAVGDLADLINSVIYATEGDWTNAVTSAAAIFVDGATVGRLGAKASKEIVGESIETVVEKAVKNSSGKLVGEVTENIGQDIAEEIWDQISEEIEESPCGSITQVDYGSTDLSQAAIQYRKANNITGARNIAMYEYEKDGKLYILAGASQRNQGHAERLLAKELENMGIQPSQVKRVYSELEPCSIAGGYCKRFLQMEFPQADITYSFEYGLTQESRSDGVKALKEAVKKIFN